MNWPGSKKTGKWSKNSTKTTWKSENAKFSPSTGKCFFIGPFAPTSIDQSWLRKLLARSFDEAFCEVQFCFGSINIVGGVESFPKLQSQTADKKVSQWKVPSWELTYPPQKALLKMIFLFPRWDMLVPWRVFHQSKLMLDPKMFPLQDFAAKSAKKCLRSSSASAPTWDRVARVTCNAGRWWRFPEKMMFS